MLEQWAVGFGSLWVSTDEAELPRLRAGGTLTRFNLISGHVSAKLTIPAMIAMNKAVAVDKKTPAAVAKAFLKANGLG